jgi:glycosyltransferase involved in cell wall biosynthesis
VTASLCKAVGFRRMRPDPDNNHVLWVSSSLSTYGGIATFVRNMRETGLWEEWNIRHVATHCDGTKLARIRIFTSGFVRFIAELLFHRPDLVHLHASERGSFVRKGILVWVAALFRLPVVMQMHGPEFHDYFENSRRPIQHMIRATLEQADAVVALGNKWAELLRDDAPRAHIEVVPNAIRQNVAVDLSAPGPVHVVFLGELCDRKGTSVLIDAWAEMLARPDIAPTKLTLAGWGEIDRARSQISALRVGDSVDVCGWLSAPEADQLLSKTHVLVLPSIQEGQPMAILEAMARGICVVSTVVGGIPEMIADSEGLLVNPGDVHELAGALAHVVNDPEARRLYGAHARQKVAQEFDLEVVAHRWDELYRAVIAGA